MSDLRELYQEVILDHNKRPRNFHALDDSTSEAKGHNPLCGDQVTIYVRLDDGRISDISFQGQGCAISKASASLMTSEMRGKTVEEAHELFQRFHHLVTSDTESETDAESLGKLAVFSGVREYPARVKCASLAWHTLEAALAKEAAPVTTE